MSKVFVCQSSLHSAHVLGPQHTEYPKRLSSRRLLSRVNGTRAKIVRDLRKSASAQLETETRDGRDASPVGASSGRKRTSGRGSSPTRPSVSDVNLDVSVKSSLRESELESEQGLPSLWSLAPFLGVGALVALGTTYREAITDNLEVFSMILTGMGPAGYFAFIAVYIMLEMLAVPAIPLTMSVGALFGVGPGLAAASLGATIAAGLAFLAARYLLRDRVQALAQEKGGRTFEAIDKALSKEGFKVVLLLRLSPLLPLSLSNYLFGLTSVPAGPYLLGSWLGMLPGTYLYVQAGALGFDLLAVSSKTSESSGAGLDPQMLSVAAGLGVSVFAIGYVTKLAQRALEDIQED